LATAKVRFTLAFYNIGMKHHNFKDINTPGPIKKIFFAKTPLPSRSVKV
jgi:hypothetical protein